MTKKKNNAQREGLHKMACTGCGRHAKLVDAGVTAYFCNNCFTMNGNYLRYCRGMEMIKPLEGIRVKDILLGADGKKYKVVGREDVSGEDKFWYVVPEGSKDPIVLGDFFFVEKVNNEKK